jgi:hypothetical protein
MFSGMAAAPPEPAGASQGSARRNKPDVQISTGNPAIPKIPLDTTSYKLYYVN